MTASRKTYDANYTDQERQVLLSGVPMTPTSTRFGHPIHGGWNRDEIAIAWDLLGDELEDDWQLPRFDHHRDRHGRPFAERYLAEHGA